ncbi:MAG: hypothetical protein ACK4MF_01065 [Hyphomicrobiaceae bacterium]
MFRLLPMYRSAAIAASAAAIVAMLPAIAVFDGGAAHAAPRAKSSAAEKAPRFAKSEDVLAFISAYRERKRPDHVPVAVKAMSDLGLLREPEEAGIYTGFIAGVLRDNPDHAEALVTAMFPMPPDSQAVLIKAIAYSGLAAWRDVLTAHVERMPSRKVLIERYLYRGGPMLDQLMTEETGAFAIDVHWGRYFATGDAEPARAVVAALAWTADRDSVEKLTIGSMAKWTLASNAARDTSLVRILNDEMNTQPEVVRRPLREVIVAAETLETSRIRKDATKAIEDLRRKGPQSTRDTVWWGQAGQTVLALGCVAAAATGQAQLGIPCVIGGALSGAALKYLVPEQ